MKLQRDIPLLSCNTLAVPASAQFFVSVDQEKGLRDAVQYSQRHSIPRLILGGGSNIVLSKDFPGLVVRLSMKGIDILEQTSDNITVAVAAGENWDELVQYSLANGWFGLENLSAIPGNVGAAPIQNIGAYGVEIGTVLKGVHGLDIESMSMRYLAAHDCELGYRNSIFKGALKDRFVITRVELELSMHDAPVLTYPALIEALGEQKPSAQNVAAAVRALRGQRLPDPKRVPNVGSFFKNPVVSDDAYTALKQKYPEMPSWNVPEGYKLAAGWLLENAGWRGYEGQAELAGVGTYAHQALVMVNPGHRPGAIVMKLADKIAASVKATFGVSLEIEPRVY